MSVCFSSASVQAGGLSSSGGQGLSVLASRRGKGISHIKDGRVDWQNHLNENLAIFIKTLKWSHSWTSIFTSRIYPVETVSVYRKKKKNKKQNSIQCTRIQALFLCWGTPSLYTFWWNQGQGHRRRRGGQTRPPPWFLAMKAWARDLRPAS